MKPHATYKILHLCYSVFFRWIFYFFDKKIKYIFLLTHHLKYSYALFPNENIIAFFLFSNVLFYVCGVFGRKYLLHYILFFLLRYFLFLPLPPLTLSSYLIFFLNCPILSVLPYDFLSTTSFHLPPRIQIRWGQFA